MSLERTLQQRSNNCCELCGNKEKLSVYNVPDTKDLAIYACETCVTQMNDTDTIDVIRKVNLSRISQSPKPNCP